MTHKKIASNCLSSLVLFFFLHFVANKMTDSLAVTAQQFKSTGWLGVAREKLPAYSGNDNQPKISLADRISGISLL